MAAFHLLRYNIYTNKTCVMCMHVMELEYEKVRGVILVTIENNLLFKRFHKLLTLKAFNASI